MLAVDRRFLRPVAAPSSDRDGMVKGWWKRAGAFDKNWTRGCAAALGLSALSLLIYASSQSDLVSFLRTAGFPPELGLTIAKPGILAATGAADASAAMPGADLSPPGLVPVSVAAATLLTMVGVALFGSARARMLTLLAGLGVGVGLSALGGLIGADTSAMVDSAPIAGMPQLRLSLPHLDLSVLPLALVLGLALSIDNLGMLLGIQRQANPDWSKMDVAQAAGGIQVSAVGDLVAGILGGMPTGISSSNVGLAETTGIYARIVSAATALVLILAAFSPRLVVALSLVPRPVVGAIMVYASAHMIASGMSLIMTRLLSPQRIFTIGFSVLIGLAAVLVPGIGTALPTIWQPVINSPVAAGSLSAIVLHALFSFRIRRTARIALDAPAEPVGRRIEDFLDRQGRLWGARREVIARAKAAALEAAEIVALTGDRRILFLTVSFDQEQLLLELAHTGPAIPLPPPLGKGTHLGALDIDTAVSAAGAALLRHFTDQLDTARGAPPATPACLILGFQH
jgi:hypothetical protein